MRRGSFQVKVEEMSVQECESLSLSRMRNQLGVVWWVDDVCDETVRLALGRGL